MCRVETQQRWWPAAARFAITQRFDKAELLQVRHSAGDSWRTETRQAHQIGFRTWVVGTQKLQQPLGIGLTEM
jgi:hypothetical protein